MRKLWAKVGIRLDYSSERFTLDEGLTDAVQVVFKKLYEKDLIYRGEYIINWDPKTKTALSDIEVIHKEVNGHFYHMRYPIKDRDDWIEIATTRAQKMLGDACGAIHPEGDRYHHIVC